MEIIINNIHQATFFPEQQKWYYQNPLSEYCVAHVGQYDCFIKRQRTKFSGWELLNKLINQGQIQNIPQILSMTTHNNHYYLFSKNINGVTLDNFLTSRLLIHPAQLIRNLHETLYAISQLGFWYTDLCKKNILVENLSGKYFLIDIDSSMPVAKKIRYSANISFEYPSILIEFAQTIAGMSFLKIEKISGECVNQAELIAIAVDIATSFNLPAKQKIATINNFLYNNYRSEYINLFTNLITSKPDWLGTKKLITSLVSNKQQFLNQ